MAKATLILALLATVATVAAATPAAAVPRTTVCGPFTPAAINIKPSLLGPLTFVIDGQAQTAQLIGPGGQPVAARIDAINPHAITIVFASREVMGDYDSYQIDISNDHGGATLAPYVDRRNPFAKGQCRAGGGVAY